ncbi:Anaphase-promoting complex subunit 8 [Nosema granulosis]|uniref:Anaphase-promoting complex subunit 8 n=1 Tax=Nosema granulosis TaxID=83296 RepID=A0A9P6GZE3_9MICR|nr:Anaphase-promoting complex subunit 8 [Nosema granulosis]
MFSDFLARGFYRTVNFLQKINIDIPDFKINLFAKEGLFICYYNLKEYRKAYFSLLCPQSQEYFEEMVFCRCCSKRVVFMRNYALLTSKKDLTIVSLCGDRDEYLLYLEGIVLKDYTKLLQAIEINNFFWDAYLELIKLTTLENVDFLEISSPLKDYFYMHLFVSKFITRKFKMLTQDSNLLAAVYYHKRDFEKAESLFREIVQNPIYFDLEHIDLYSNILYMNKDPELSILAQRALEINRFRPETLCCIANLYSLNKDHEKAKEYYEMCIKINPSYSIAYTLLGNEYLEGREIKKAIKAYNTAIRACNEDYRAWYNLGRAYEILGMNETSLFFYKKAVEFKKNDFLIWRSLGTVYLNLQDYENAIRAYKRVVQLKEPEGYMLIAEVYKTMKKYTECVDYYEKYVNSLSVLDEDSKRICAFLEEYFKKVCDIDKSIKYKEMHE